MKKTLSLIRATFTSDMSIFKINTKKKSKKTKLLLPIFVALCLMYSMWSYADMILEKLEPVHLQYVALSIFTFITAIMTFIEGIYKSGSLLFNCRDDQLLLSLPLKKSTILFVRLFKFYVFELLFNSLLMLPAMIAYVSWAKVDASFYLVSVLMLFLLPIIPIVLSCVIGAIITSVSSRFKYKNLSQILLTFIIFLGIMYISMNLDTFITDIAKNATSVNDFISKVYYPAGVYANLAISFDISELLIFIAINMLILALLILILSKFYFKINSRLKKVTTHRSSKSIKIKRRSQTRALIRKEMNTFFKTPVFITNAGFGVVIFLVAVCMIVIKYDSVVEIFKNVGFSGTTIDINEYIPLFVLFLIAFSSFTTSITSSMISIEGKSFNILKSLPVSPKKVLMSKVYASLLLTVPAFIIGDIIIFVRMNMDINDMLLLVLLTILMPLVSSFIGLIINIKYPKLDAENSTEVVKQSMSSMISVVIGIVLLALTSYLIMLLKDMELGVSTILFIFTISFFVIDFLLYLFLTIISIKEFKTISS